MSRLADGIYKAFIGELNPNKNISVFSSEFNVPYGLHDPTYITFDLRFDTQPSAVGFEFGTHSSLLLPEDDVNSAINYLRRINLPDKANMLYRFREELINIMENKSWIFHNIKGIDSVLGIKPDLPFREKDAKFTIDCYESIDNQTEFWINLYRNASFDHDYRRKLLFGNMELFDMSITVREIRDLYEVVYKTVNAYEKKPSNFQDGDITNSKGTIVGTVSKVLASAGSDDTVVDKNTFEGLLLSNIAEKLTYKILSCETCVFDFEETYTNSWGDLSKSKLYTELEPVSYSFDIKPGPVREKTEYGLYKTVIDSHTGLSVINRTVKNVAYTGTEYKRYLAEDENYVSNNSISNIDDSWKDGELESDGTA